VVAYKKRVFSPWLVVVINNIGEDRVAFNEACEYPDGTRVLVAITLDVRDGKVVQQVNVEAWDE
jgi:hypothetical protein